MPAYSFKSYFVEPIKKKSKQQTIRSKRKHQAKPGDRLYLYYGMRTKFCMKIGEADCKAVYDIDITHDGRVLMDGMELTASQKEHLAKKDGFKNFVSMLNWWQRTHELPFNGNLIKWKNFKKA